MNKLSKGALRAATSTLAVVFFAGCALAQPLATARVADDGVITLTDDGFRDWGPELVHYRLDTNKFRPGRLQLTDEKNRAVPFQISDDAVTKGKVLSFVAKVGKGETSRYRLASAPRDSSRENSALRVVKSKNETQIGNEYFTVALPAPGGKTFSTPVAADGVPTPLLRWKPADGAWMGATRFVTKRRVAEYSVQQIESGPASVVWRARYRFAPGGEYVFQVRISGGVPVAQVTEEFDQGAVTEGREYLMLSLHANASAGQIGFLPSGEGSYPTKWQPLPEFIASKSADWEKNLTARSIPADPTLIPLAAPPEKGDVLLDRIGIGFGTKGGLALGAAPPSTPAAGETVPTTATVTMSPYFGGSWRRATGLGVWHNPQRGVEVALPISARQVRWHLDVTDDESPFSTHEHDATLPATFGRRVWALGFNDDSFDKTRTALGNIGLNRYKNWTLQWPEKKVVFPRSFATPELVARLRKTLDAHPEKEQLMKLYLFDGQTETAIKNARTVIGSLKAPGHNDWNTVGITSYRQASSFVYLVYADDALSCPELPADLRAELRRSLALHAYLYSEPDINMRGAGVHLGNPNMPIGRTLVQLYFASLLPDHPRYDEWMNAMKAFTQWKLAALTDPSGAWFEPPTYQMYGPTRALSLAQVMLRNGGWGDLSKLDYHKRALRYNANLTMPDARFKGWRILPGMGNSGNSIEGIFGISSGVFDQSDKAEAGFLTWMHDLASGNNRVSVSDSPEYSFLLAPPDVPKNPQPLKSTFIAGYGMVFRAHFGSPLETGMLFRSGTNKSHWDMDDLNTILYGKGAPLSPGTGYQYYYGEASQNNAIYHNRIQVGKEDAVQLFGRVDNAIQDYALGDAVDYAVSRIYYPPQYFEDKKEMDWRRHIVFVKSARADGPNYFVMRDTFPGGEHRKTWWHWLNLDGPELITQNGRDLEMKTKHGASTHFWFAGETVPTGKVLRTFDYALGPDRHHRVFAKTLGIPGPEDKETKTIYQIEGAPGQEYFYVVYPRKDGEKLPEFSQAGPGCLKIVSDEATDYVFASDQPLRFEQDGVLFEGKAGAVRIFKDRVVFSMSSGNGRIGYQGRVFSGLGPFERTIPLAGLKAEETKLEGGYSKETKVLSVAPGIEVRGEAPFEASLKGEEIHLRTDGRERVLHITRPPFISYPQLLVDGQEWAVNWTDYPSSGYGTYKNTALMAVAVPAGTHELVIRQRTIPAVWPKQFVPMIERARE